MGFPTKKELARVRKKLSKAEPVRILPPDASASNRLKYALCKKFVVYLREHEVSQLQLARELGIDPARVSEIVKYRIDLFTADRLLDYCEMLEPSLKVTVA